MKSFNVNSLGVLEDYPVHPRNKKKRKKTDGKTYKSKKRERKPDIFHIIKLSLMTIRD